MPSKSDLIRSHLRVNPRATASEVAQALGVSPHLVYAAARRGGMPLVSPYERGKTPAELRSEAQLYETKAQVLREKATRLEKTK
jgi:transposase-like protein